MGLLKHKAYQHRTDQQCKREEYDVHRNRVIVERLMGERVEAGLGEVEQAREADYKAINFAEGGKAKDFGAVVTGTKLAFHRQ